jgi:hypothetical protein
MMTATISRPAQLAYGPRVDLSDKAEIYSPQVDKLFTSPPAGIDNLGITSTDSFMIPGIGELTVDFKGFVRVVRSEPSAANWVNATVYTNLIELSMRGESSQCGPILVTLNPDYLSTGQLKTPFADMECQEPEKTCRMAVGALFSLPKLNLTLFNKEPILLTIDHVRAIPPAGNPGVGRIYELLPLFNCEDPDGPPVAYLTALEFAMGNYISEAQVEAIRVQNQHSVQPTPGELN